MEAVYTLQKNVMIDGEVFKTVVDAGIGVFAISVISFLFYKTQQGHKDERKEWRKSSEEQSTKVVGAIEKLAKSINSNSNDV